MMFKTNRGLKNAREFTSKEALRRFSIILGRFLKNSTGVESINTV